MVGQLGPTFRSVLTVHSVLYWGQGHSIMFRVL